MTARRSIALALAVLVAALVGTVDLVLGPVEPDSGPDPQAEVEPVAGLWVCPASGVDADAQLSVGFLSGPGDGEANVEVLTYDDGEEVVSRFDLGPNQTRWSEPAGVVGGRWLDAPVAIHREWAFAGGDLPPGTVAGGCVYPVADRWIVPGLATVGGAEARIRVTNPFRSAASVAVRFVGPEGVEAPLALQNLSVGARSSLEVVVNESLPERQDLGAIIEVTAGRVAVEGVQLVRSAIGGIDGVSLLAAAPQAAESWTIPWVVDSELRPSWLWVVNPGESPASVELTLHTAEGGLVPNGLEEVVVDPGTLRRIDLRGSFPDGVEVAGVTVRSEGVPVVVSAAVEVADPESERTGFAVQLGATSPDRTWLVGGGSTQERVEQLHLVNPGSTPAVVDVVLTTDVGVRRPGSLREIRVPAGAARTVDITGHLGETRTWSAQVTAADAGVVVGRVGGSTTGERRLVAVLGTPSSAWTSRGTPLVASAGSGMVHRLHTALGVRPEDPFSFGPAPPADPDDPPADPPEPTGSPPPAPRVPEPVEVVPGDGVADEEAEEGTEGDGADADAPPDGEDEEPAPTP